MDILGIAASGFLTVVELKRPGKTLSREDLEQIEGYVDWARANLLSTGPHSLTGASGLLIVGSLSSNKAIQEKARRLGGDQIRVETFDDLYNRAIEYYGEVERVLRKHAPEYRLKKTKTASKNLPAVS